ncbi:glutamate decarboxylase, putative [Talaromyces marneffei ATCC 18224]|uniref:Glutamate decarboxylase n=1 Tax=Talaromyces marneffei (strain ATCC 18224 / CBS 334.59 / QM 7333) TaxID=441960 RepID=B6QH75_TALMQ|nr:glutamate decarboxylase, putative [Talaromyces marneffei ATCC 18224]
MTLSSHVDPDELIKALRDGTHDSLKSNIHTENAFASSTPYSTRYASKEAIPKFRMPIEGTPADAAAQMLRDELDLDGRPNLNLASFVGTYMERQANALMAENLSKNLSDADEYPALMAMHARCVSIIASLWNAQPNEKAIGSATVGSSEAIMLGGKAMQRRWQEKRKAAGKDISRPNILMGANAQVALEKFARYFDVEARILDVSEKSNFGLDPESVRKNIDENTIGVFVILGSTYTGHYEPVEEISKILDEYEAETGHDIPIHVDGASGGFIAPFAYAGGGQKWNFELPRVRSINTSGHKFGLVYAGLGWIIWRDQSYLPKDLVFELHYLGGTEESYTLNFSRPGGQVIGQYYNLIHLGFNGYRDIMENCLANARLLSIALEKTGWFTCVSSIHRKKTIKAAKNKVLGKGQETSADYVAGLPVVAFRFSDEFQKEYPHVKQESVSILLRAKQYIIPNYPLPPTANNIEILRVVVRESMSADLLECLIADIVAVTERLVQSDPVDLSTLQTQAHRTRVERRRNRSGKHGQQAQNKSPRWMTRVHKSITKFFLIDSFQPYSPEYEFVQWEVALESGSDIRTRAPGRKEHPGVPCSLTRGRKSGKCPPADCKHDWPIERKSCELPHGKSEGKLS